MCSAFARFWQTDLTREAFLEEVTQDELRTLRLVSLDIAADVAVKLFKTVKVDFDAFTFTRRSRMLALDRIGHNIKHFHFNLAHSDATFLPPLIDPETLEEVNFQYEPQHRTLSRPSSSSSEESVNCKYGSWDVNDLLVRQYPPLFHAATDTTSFMRALNAMPILRHITISCPDQPANQRFRRTSVDYALISLRLAIEAIHPPFLDTLTLDEIHPSAIFYLRPHNGIGTSPASTRVWYRIKTVNISMQNYNGVDSSYNSSEHLKILHTYLQTFRSMQSLTFKWLGEPGPCPLSLDAEPCTSRPSSLDCSTACPVTAALPACRPIKFRKLKSMKLENAILDASQASRFITSHRKSVRHIDFTTCSLRTGTWDEALAPLENMAVNEDWRTEVGTSTSSSFSSEVMEVPIWYTPVEEIGNPMECVQEALWDHTDRHVMRAVDKVAKDVFRHAMVRRRRDIVVCGLKALLRHVGGRRPCLGGIR